MGSGGLTGIFTGSNALPLPGATDVQPLIRVWNMLRALRDEVRTVGHDSVRVKELNRRYRRIADMGEVALSESLASEFEAIFGPWIKEATDSRPQELEVIVSGHLGWIRGILDEVDAALTIQTVGALIRRLAPE